AQALQLASREEVCFVRYEDLIADPLGALHTIASFMGATVPSHSLREAVSAVERSDGYRLRVGSGYTYPAEPGSLYEPVQRDRGGDYWRKLFDADARRYFHVRGGTPGLLHFGYESHEDWWRATVD
ncbi:MAG: sulfotransferase domain-containing protein, partial [Solirubrobacteraceae bacterium]